MVDIAFCLCLLAHELAQLASDERVFSSSSALIIAQQSAVISCSGGTVYGTPKSVCVLLLRPAANLPPRCPLAHSAPGIMATLRWTVPVHSIKRSHHLARSPRAKMLELHFGDYVNIPPPTEVFRHPFLHGGRPRHHPADACGRPNRQDLTPTTTINSLRQLILQTTTSTFSQHISYHLHLGVASQTHSHYAQHGHRQPQEGPSEGMLLHPSCPASFRHTYRHLPRGLPCRELSYYAHRSGIC